MFKGISICISGGGYLEGNCLCIFGGQHYEEYFCDIILNLDQWLGDFFKHLSFLTLVAILLSRAEKFVQFWLSAL